jgi:putative mRNA 3-end processing factor
MEISFQHTNPLAGHESTLLHVSTRDDDTYSYLIDAGESVSPAAFLDTDAELDGVFLTHAHTDHYASLSQILSTASDTQLYTSPGTATMFEDVYTEADRYQDLGDVTHITEALTPIDTWTPLNDGVFVLPVPAGHTLGAAGFLFRIDDLRNNETVTVLTTGDFTTRPVGGYPSLTIPESIDIDIMIANAATSPHFEDDLNDALEVLLERGLSGATTLVAASALTSVHIAYLLGHVLDELDRQLPIHLAGQAAKLYTTLDYDVPFVSAHPQFEHTDEVLASGAITIAGPEAPTQGSIARLYGVIKDDPDAVFVQLTTSGVEAVDDGECTTHYAELANHPTKQQFINTVEENLPRHLILKHVRPEHGKEIGANFDNLFHWSNDDTQAHVLYDDGDWPAPHWVDDGTASRIRRRNYQQSGSRLLIDRPIDELPTASMTRQSPELSAEGVEITPFKDRYESIQSIQQPPSDESASGEEEQESPGVHSDAEDSNQPPSIDTELLTDITERLDALEATLDDIRDTIPTEETVTSGIDTLEDRIDDIEADISSLPDQIDSDDGNTISSTVLRQEDLVLFRVKSDVLADQDLSLSHQQDVKLKIVEVSDDQSKEK